MCFSKGTADGTADVVPDKFDQTLPFLNAKAWQRLLHRVR